VIRSVGAIVAGLAFTIVVTTLADFVLHAAGVYSMQELPTGRLAVLAIPQCWLGGKLEEMRRT
jgi:hypothetical protein